VELRHRRQAKSNSTAKAAGLKTPALRLIQRQRRPPDGWFVCQGFVPGAAVLRPYEEKIKFRSKGCRAKDPGATFNSTAKASA
jgi:hypothetical protein